jgi:F420-non-reducing hydrogenase iron-sulfur subunit
MCSGRIDPAFVLEAFKQGADGVLVAGCHLPADCHYLSGNFKAQKRILMLKNVLEQFGIEPERLRLEWVSASEGERFARIVTEMVEKIRKLGPSPLNNGEENND